MWCEKYQRECEVVKELKVNQKCECESYDCDPNLSEEEAYAEMMEMTRNMWGDPSYY